MSTADKLAPYRAKRDFTVTAEPEGVVAPSAASGDRFVVQRHRARRLHYDLRLEVDGVLVSWAVPKGPTLDPAARHLAVHVEDHPLDYFDFEGVIPEGEYGGGDVIVWDWGSWAPVRTNDPARAIADGELHFDLAGQKLSGRFVLIRRDDKQDRGRQWLLIHKKDEAAEPGWDPEEHPQSVKSGKTNDEVKAAPPATWRRDQDGEPEPAWATATADELDVLAALGKKGDWAVGGRAVALTDLDKVLFPGRNGEEPVTKRELIAYVAVIAPHLLPYTHDRPLNLHRYPNGADKPGIWQKEVPGRAPKWIRRWRDPDADPGTGEGYVVADETATLVWLADHGALELHPWTSTADQPQRPTWALIDLDPGSKTTFADLLVLARLHRVALEHVGVAAMPKVTGRRGIQIWVPVAPRYTFDQTRAWVEKISRAIGATVPDLASGAGPKRERKGRARLDSTQNAVDRALVAPFSTRPASGAPVSVPITWDELDDPELRPDRWTIRTVLDRLEQVGDPLRPLIGLDQALPDL